MKEEGLIIFHNEQHPELKIDSDETEVDLWYFFSYIQGEVGGERNENSVSMDKSLENNLIINWYPYIRERKQS